MCLIKDRPRHAHIAVSRHPLCPDRVVFAFLSPISPFLCAHLAVSFTHGLKTAGSCSQGWINTSEANKEVFLFLSFF